MTISEVDPGVSLSIVQTRAVSWRHPIATAPNIGRGQPRDIGPVSADRLGGRALMLL
ncbi:MAG: hypothetical protein IPN84_17970 [Sphingomonadales bacterium]|nr:hypothetical protein [Sphingomonadales bacterium]